MMPYNKGDLLSGSVLEIQSLHFFAQPSQTRAVQKRSGFTFPSTDQVAQLVNLNYKCFLTMYRLLKYER